MVKEPKTDTTHSELNVFLSTKAYASLYHLVAHESKKSSAITLLFKNTYAVKYNVLRNYFVVVLFINWLKFVEKNLTEI